MFAFLQIVIYLASPRLPKMTIDCHLQKLYLRVMKMAVVFARVGCEGKAFRNLCC